MKEETRSISESLLITFIVILFNYAGYLLIVYSHNFNSEIHFYIGFIGIIFSYFIIYSILRIPTKQPKEQEK